MSNSIYEILSFLKNHGVKLNENFSIIVNQGPGSFSSIRVSLSIAKGLEISKIKLYGFKDSDLKAFNIENIEKLLKKIIGKKIDKAYLFKLNYVYEYN